MEDEMGYVRSEDVRVTGKALTIILKQFLQTKDINQALEDIFLIIGEG